MVLHFDVFGRGALDGGLASGFVNRPGADGVGVVLGDDVFDEYFGLGGACDAGIRGDSQAGFDADWEVDDVSGAWPGAFGESERIG